MELCWEKKITKRRKKLCSIYEEALKMDEFQKCWSSFLHVALSNQIPHRFQSVLYKQFSPVFFFFSFCFVTPPPQADLIDNFAATPLKPVQFWDRNPSNRPALVAQNENLVVFCLPAFGIHHNFDGPCTVVLWQPAECQSIHIQCLPIHIVLYCINFCGAALHLWHMAGTDRRSMLNAVCFTFRPHSCV